MLIKQHCQKEIYGRQLLVAANVLIEAKDRYGDTALHYAARRAGNGEMCQWLLDVKAEIVTKNHNGNTALHIAATRGEMDTCQLLVSLKANIETTNSYCQTALMLTLNGHCQTAIVRQLTAIGHRDVCPTR